MPKKKSKSNTIAPWWAKKELKLKLNGRNLTVYEYNDKAVTNETAGELTADLLNDIKKKGKNNRVWISNYYNDTIGWQTGKSTEFQNNLDPDDLNFYNFKEQYPEYGGPALQDTFNRFLVITDAFDTAGGASKDNDCLWLALRQMYGGQAHLPTMVNAGWKVCKICGVPNRAKIPVDSLGALEDKLKINIHVQGDVERVPTKEYLMDFHVRLENGHYTLVKASYYKSRQLIRKIPTVDKDIAVYRAAADGKFECYDDNGYRELLSDQLMKAARKPLSHPIIYRKIDSRDKRPLEDIYHEQINGANQLYEKNPLLNMYRQSTFKKSAFFLFHYRSLGIPDPQPLTAVEQRFCEYANHGGLIMSVPGDLEYGICYDMNKMYMSVLTHKHMRVYWKQGKYETFATDHFDDTARNVAGGIYRCRIIPNGEKVERLFRFSSNNYYTHHDIRTAREMGMKVEMIDKSPNAVLYSNMTGRGMVYPANKVFGPFVKSMSELVKADIPYAKKIMNSLWGGLCQKNTKIFDDGADRSNFDTDETDFKDHDIDHIEPAFVAGKPSFRVKLVDREQRFATDYARIGPFVTSFARREMYLALRDHVDHVFRIHTDGFVADKKIELRMSSKIGDWKVESKDGKRLEGPCRVVNCNEVIFF